MVSRSVVPDTRRLAGARDGITLTYGHRSVELLDVPLAMVMTDVGARTGIALHMENASALPRVTSYFSDMLFAEGLSAAIEAAAGQCDGAK